MAHLCPECGMKCHCGGDIDDLCFDVSAKYCCHCDNDDYDPDFEKEPEIDFDEAAEDNSSNDSRNL